MSAGPQNRFSRLSRLRPAGPYLVLAALFAAGLFALHRLLAPVSLGEVMQQIRATPRAAMGLAMLATAAGYVALIGYEWAALRYIGRRLGLPLTALGGFLAHALGNTIGANALSGGAVRYRVYSAFGLDAYDIGAIVAFTTVSFAVGVLSVAAGALVAHPGALAGLVAYDPGLARWAAAAVLAGLLALLAFLSVRRAELRIGRVRIAAPAPWLTAAQLLIATADVILAATVLYLLLPAGGLPFTAFLAVFAVALKAGVLSHVPGGVGIFEAVIIAAMPPSAPLGQVAAALLLYRLVYYLLPFAIAIAVLALNEVRMAAGAAGIRIGRAGGRDSAARLPRGELARAACHGRDGVRLGHVAARLSAGPGHGQEGGGARAP